MYITYRDKPFLIIVGRPRQAGVAALVQLLKQPTWKIGYREFDPRSGVQVSKKQNVSSLLTRKYLFLWGASLTESNSERVLRPPGSNLLRKFEHVEGVLLITIKVEIKIAKKMRQHWYENMDSFK